MTRPPRPHLLLPLALVAACVAGPEAPTATRSPAAPAGAHDVHAAHGAANAEPPTRGQLELAARVAAATAAFRDRDAALAAGYVAQFPAGCAQLPDGSAAQGFHYLDPDRVDHRIELLRPELVMYEPQANGQMVLVGVDYVVPFTAWKAKNPPTLLGREFMRNEPLGVWALHIWTERANPDGLFAAWNPDVSCAHAGAVTP